MLSLKWDNFFEPTTGKFREDILEIQEDKMDKLANPRINSSCREAIKLYVEKTGCNVSDSGYLKALRKVGIEYNVGTHSPRKHSV